MNGVTTENHEQPELWSLDHAEAERILKCIKTFSAAEWKGCLYDEKFECGCGNDHGINYCCGSADQAEAIEIWSECLARE